MLIKEFHRKRKHDKIYLLQEYMNIIRSSRRKFEVVEVAQGIF